MLTVDKRLVKEIETALLRPRPVFQSPAEFSIFLASEIEYLIKAREEVAYRMGEAGVKKTEQYSSA